MSSKPDDKKMQGNIPELRCNSLLMISVPKMIISNTLGRSKLKSYSALKVPRLKKTNVQAHLRFTNNHLVDSE